MGETRGRRPRVPERQLTKPTLPPAKPMQWTRALRKMTMLTIAASTAIQTNEGPQSRHTREPSKIEGGDYWIARIIKLVVGLAKPEASAGR